MAYSTEMGADGNLRLAFSGEMTTKDTQSSFSDLQSFWEVATEAEPLDFLASRQGMDKYTSLVRKFFIELNAYPQIGRVAVLRISRYGRVLADFILKATGRDNVRFFESEKDALVWLKEGS